MLDARYPHQVPSYQVTTADSPQKGIVLSHPSRRRNLSVNVAGAVVWALCDGQRTLAEIAQILIEAYPESAPDIEQNVRDTLLALTEHGAIEWT
jgi:hypothetical protein